MVNVKNQNSSVLIFLFLFLLLILPTNDHVNACAPAPPLNRRVEVAEETALIIWDAKAGVEHFIRRATFRSDAPDFGFLVPTPTIPELVQEPDSVFVRMEDLMRPQVVYTEQKGIRPVSFFASFFLMGKSRSFDGMVTSAPPVRVLASKTVSGYDATVLEADNADALLKWLQEHGYAASPSLLGWVQPYIEKKWKITAFKISGDQNGESIGTSPVRMSFKTDAPFFPYREPEDQRTNGSTGPRLLRVFFLGDKRMQGKIGSVGNSWNGVVRWTNGLDAKSLESATAELNLKRDQLPENPWLTVFEDASSPRPGTDDLYFVISDTQDKIVPPPIVEETDNRTSVPIDLILLLIVSWIVIRRVLKRRTIKTT
jgi:hypothetical protein